MHKVPSTIFEALLMPSKVEGLPSHIVNPPRLFKGFEIEASPINVTMWPVGAMTVFPPSVINPALNIYFESASIDVTLEVLGSWPYVNVSVDSVDILTLIYGTILIGEVLSSTSLIELIVSLGLPEINLVGSKTNWVKWSNIGNLDFELWKDNVAGERPLDWAGWVYSIRKLGNKVIVYGDGGISMLAPSGNAFGLLPIHKVGLKGKQAIAGDDKIQYFVDAIGKLQRLLEVPQKSSLFEQSIVPEELDYSEYLSNMTNPILSWDALNKLLYICDGTSGYIYSQDSNSLGSGPANITGIGLRNNEAYIVSPSTIENPIFEICTDIYDMGSRKNKTITTIELGTDVIGDLWVTLDYRKNKAEEFKTLTWHRVSPNGVTNIPCFGVEFRIRVKRTTYAYFELDYIRVNGIVHDYAFQYPYVGR